MMDFSNYFNKLQQIFFVQQKVLSKCFSL